MANKTLTTQIILRNGTTTEWEASTKILKLGEVGIDTTKNEIRIGDGEHTWKDLKIAGADQAAIQALIDQAEDKVTVVQAGDGTIDEALATITSPSQGDMAIVEQKFGDVAKADGTRTSRTAYSYDGAKWCAMDGNYNAKNVYFDGDFTYTNAIGAIGAPSGGSGKLAASGKSVEEFMASILAKEANPTITKPAASVKITEGSGTFEIGTHRNISYSASLSAGSYTYGPDTGVVAGTVTASFDGQTKTGATGTFDNVVADGTKRLSVSITHNEGAVPKTNLGNPYAEGKIAAGTKTATASQTLVGVRHMFYGPMTTDAELNSENIRKLKHEEASRKTIGTFGAGADAVKVVVAVPASMNVTKVLMPSAMNADATASFVKQAGSVQVEGAEGFTAAAYNVWVYKPASIDSTETYAVTIG
jgi:hypothetical protein